MPTITESLNLLSRSPSRIPQEGFLPEGVGEPGIGAKIFSAAFAPLSLVGSLFELVDAPTRALAGQVINLFGGDVEASGEGGKTTGIDLLEGLGFDIDKADPGTAAVLAGLATELAVSPFNFIGGVFKLAPAAEKVARIAKLQRRLKALRATRQGFGELGALEKDANAIRKLLASKDTRQALGELRKIVRQRAPEGLFKTTAPRPEAIEFAENEVRSIVSRMRSADFQAMSAADQARLREEFTKALLRRDALRSQLANARSGGLARIEQVLDRKLSEQLRAGVRETVLFQVPFTSIKKSLYEISPRANEAIINVVEATEPFVAPLGKVLKGFAPGLRSLFRPVGRIGSEFDDKTRIVTGQGPDEVATLFEGKEMRKLLNEFADISAAIRRQAEFDANLEFDRINKFLASANKEEAAAALLSIKKKLNILERFGAEDVETKIRLVPAKLRLGSKGADRLVNTLGETLDKLEAIAKDAALGERSEMISRDEALEILHDVFEQSRMLGIPVRLSLERDFGKMIGKSSAVSVDDLNNLVADYFNRIRGNKAFVEPRFPAKRTQLQRLKELMEKSLEKGDLSRYNKFRVAYELERRRLNPLIGADLTKEDPVALALQLAIEHLNRPKMIEEVNKTLIADAKRELEQIDRAIKQLDERTRKTKIVLIKKKNAEAKSQLLMRKKRIKAVLIAKLGRNRALAARSEIILADLPRDVLAEANRINLLGKDILKAEQRAGANIVQLADVGLDYLFRSITQEGRALLQFFKENQMGLPEETLSPIFSLTFGPTRGRIRAFDAMGIHGINDFIDNEVRLLQASGAKVPFRPGLDKFLHESADEIMLRRILAGGSLRANAAYLAGFVNAFRIPAEFARKGDIPIEDFLETTRLGRVEVPTPFGARIDPSDAELFNLGGDFPNVGVSEGLRIGEGTTNVFDRLALRRRNELTPEQIQELGKRRFVRDPITGKIERIRKRPSLRDEIEVALKGTPLEGTVIPGEFAPVVLRAARAVSQPEAIRQLGSFFDKYNNLMRFWVTVGAIPITTLKKLGPRKAALVGGAALGAVGGAAAATPSLLEGEAPTFGKVASGLIGGGIAGAVSGALAGVSGMWQIAPAFTIRNVASNLFNMWLAGFSDFKSLTRAAEVMTLAKRAAAKGYRGLTVAEREAVNLIREAATGGAFQASRLGEFEVLVSQTAPFRGSARQLARALGIERVVPESIKPRLRKVGTRAEDVTRLVIDPFSTKGGKEIMRINMDIESHAKLSLYLDGLSKGMTPGEAAERVRKFLFDYSELSPFEKKTLRRFAFFYTWMRKNIPLQIERLFGDPIKARLFITAGGERDGSIQNRLLREFQKDRFPLPGPRLPDGTRVFFAFGLPVEDLNTFRLSEDQVLSSIARVFERVAAMSAPGVRAPLEVLARRNFQTGRPQSFGNLVSGLAPTSRLQSQLGTLFNVASGRRPASELLRLGGFGPIVSQTPFQAAVRNEIDRLRRFQEELAARGVLRQIPAFTVAGDERFPLGTLINRRLGTLVRAAGP